MYPSDSFVWNFEQLRKLRMAPIDAVAKAKYDLEQAGYTWKTPCDAYLITNLAAQRMGWKLIEKKSGDNCNGRKVDGLIVDGMAIDCLVNAGPPLNENTPAWNILGPQNALVALDPIPMEDPAGGGGNPVPPNPTPPSDIIFKLDQITWLCTITYNQTVINGQDLQKIKSKLGIV